MGRVGGKKGKGGNDVINLKNYIKWKLFRNGKYIWMSKNSAKRRAKLEDLHDSFQNMNLWQWKQWEISKNNRCLKHQNRTGSPEIDPHECNQLFWDIGPMANHWRTVFSVSNPRTTECPSVKRSKRIYILTWHTWLSLYENIQCNLENSRIISGIFQRIIPVIIQRHFGYSIKE